jgi:phosphoribosylformimino-5-aminoimidazole carboxamide ribotide isomerase
MAAGMNFTVYPAIDVRGGRVVRLRQGDYAQETRYADDAFALAVRYAEKGARWLHLVDLDAARSGGYTLRPLLRQIAASGRLQVQTGGGVRRAGDVQDLLDAGASRVVVGSMAITDPDGVSRWLDRFGADRLVLALDTQRDDAGIWRLPVHGWTEAGTVALFELLDRYSAAGAQHVLCTDIARDGMLGGPNRELYTLLTARYPALAIQASGGIRDIDDLAALRATGCAGAITGKALLSGLLDLEAALAC